MKDKVLVVGATGLVGQEVVKGLVARGERVKGATHSGRTIPGAEATEFDFHRPETFDPALEDVDRVFLLTPNLNLTEADEVVPPFVERLKWAQIRRLVCMTGLTANRPGAPMSGIEAAVKASGVPYTLLRPNWFNQNFAPGFYLQSIHHAGGVFVPAAEARISFVDTRDIAAVAVAALTEDGHAGREYVLTGPEALTHREACQILTDATGREITYTPVSDDQMREALGQFGMPPASIEEMVRLFRITREGACDLVSRDVETVLGRRPIPFARYAAEYAEMMVPAVVG